MTKTSAGLDVYAEKETNLPLNQVVLVETGLIIQIPEGCHIKLYMRSSLAVKHQISLINNVGIIDEDYCGEGDFIKIPLIRFDTGTSKANFCIEKGERIGQILFEKTEFPNIIWDEQKNANFAGKSRGGFGSTGLK